MYDVTVTMTVIRRRLVAESDRVGEVFQLTFVFSAENSRSKTTMSGASTSGSGACCSL